MSTKPNEGKLMGMRGNRMTVEWEGNEGKWGETEWTGEWKGKWGETEWGEWWEWQWNERNQMREEWRGICEKPEWEGNDSGMRETEWEGNEGEFEKPNELGNEGIC